MITKIIKLNDTRYKSLTKCLGTLLIVGSLFYQISTNPAIAEELLKTLTVTGNGMEKIPSTIAQVELGVEIQGKTANEVQQEVAKQTSAVVDLLRAKEEVEQLQTTGVRLNPNYDRVDSGNGQRILTGYIGTNTVNFRVSTEQVGNLLDETVQAGASRVDGVSFTATDEAIAAAKKAALRKASIDAQDRADVVLDTLNLTSQEIVNIEVDAARISQPRSFANRQLAVSESDISTPIIAGEQTVRASVTLQISY
ncbi:MAG: SIMPL domain-containing protein [Cyanobacteria bacterium P01_A01_bin.83]